MKAVGKCSLHVCMGAILWLVSNEKEFKCEGFKHEGGERTKLKSRKVGREKYGICVMKMCECKQATRALSSARVWVRE